MTSTSPVIVIPDTFTDPGVMPHVNTDERRIITEKVTPADDGKIDRVTRIEVTGTEVPLGNHYHDFEERFVGTGGGQLLTVHKDDPHQLVTVTDLPEDGWSVTIPPRVTHTFVLSVGALLASYTDRHFVSERNQHEYPDEPINTHVDVLI